MNKPEDDPHNPFEGDPQNHLRRLSESERERIGQLLRGEQAEAVDEAGPMTQDMTRLAVMLEFLEREPLALSPLDRMSHVGWVVEMSGRMSLRHHIAKQRTTDPVLATIDETLRAAYFAILVQGSDLLTLLINDACQEDPHLAEVVDGMESRGMRPAARRSACRD